MFFFSPAPFPPPIHTTFVSVFLATGNQPYLRRNPQTIQETGGYVFRRCARFLDFPALAPPKPQTLKLCTTNCPPWTDRKGSWFRFFRL
jgi:hypothetical protein